MDKNNLISNIYHCENRSHTSFSFAPAERELEIIETVKACGAGNGDSHVIAYAHNDGSFYACFWLRGEIIAAEQPLAGGNLHTPSGYRLSVSRGRRGNPVAHHRYLRSWAEQHHSERRQLPHHAPNAGGGEFHDTAQARLPGHDNSVAGLSPPTH